MVGRSIVEWLCIWIEGGRVCTVGGWFDRCSMFNFRCSIFDFQCSMLNARCSIFDVRCSIFDVRCSIGLVFEEARDTCKCGRSSDFLNENCLTVGAADGAIRAHNCKLLQCEELHERLDCKSMEINWYIYMKYGPKGCRRSRQ